MREELMRIKSKVDTLIAHLNSSYRDKEIRNLDYSSLEEAVSIIEEFVSRVKLKKYRFSYSFIFHFPSLVINSEIHLLITQNKVIHRFGNTRNYSPIKYKHSALLLNFHTKETTSNKERMESYGAFKEIAERKNLKFANTLILENRYYHTVYFFELPLKVETLEYII
jgi:hypothetical protein